MGDEKSHPMLDFLREGLQANKAYTGVDAAPGIGLQFVHTFVDPANGETYSVKHRVLTITKNISLNRRLGNIYTDSAQNDIVVSHVFSRHDAHFPGLPQKFGECLSGPYVVGVSDTADYIIKEQLRIGGEVFKTSKVRAKGENVITFFDYPTNGTPQLSVFSVYPRGNGKYLLTFVPSASGSLEDGVLATFSIASFHRARQYYANRFDVLYTKQHPAVQKDADLDEGPIQLHGSSRVIVPDTIIPPPRAPLHPPVPLYAVPPVYEQQEYPDDVVPWTMAMVPLVIPERSVVPPQTLNVVVNLPPIFAQSDVPQESRRRGKKTPAAGQGTLFPPSPSKPAAELSPFLRTRLFTEPGES